MAKYSFADLCDIPWWEAIESDDEKDEFCRKEFGISFDEYLSNPESAAVVLGYKRKDSGNK